jgi:hypothetical protein
MVRLQAAEPVRLEQSEEGRHDRARCRLTLEAKRSSANQVITLPSLAALISYRKT